MTGEGRDVRPEPAWAAGSGSWLRSAATPRWVSDHVGLVGAAPGEPLADMAALLPSEPDVVTMVGQLDGDVDWPAVAAAMAVIVPPGSRGRLAVARAGAPGLGLAARLAEDLSASILAPSGDLLVVPGATLFAVHGWRRYSARETGAPAGRRTPLPDWEGDVDALSGPASGGDRGGSPLVRLPIPAGLWVYREVDGSTLPPLDDPGYSVPQDSRRPTLLVGRPGHPQPTADEVMALVMALSPEVRRRLVLAPYGPDGQTAALVAETLARTERYPVRLATGRPALTADGAVVTVAESPDGPWLPHATTLVYRPNGAARPEGPLPAFAGLPSVGDGVFRLDDSWVVELTASGLWVRPAADDAYAQVVRGYPWDSARLRVVVGAPGRPPGPESGPLLGALLGRLPGATRRRVHTDAGPVGTAPVAPGPAAGSGAAGSGPVATAAGEDRPDLEAAPTLRQPPSWWRPDPRLVSVLVEVRADGSLGLGPSVAGPDQLGELVAERTGADGRPILLVAERTVPRELCQRLADQVQRVVVGGGPAGMRWYAVQPRRIGDEPPAVALTGDPPFPDSELGGFAVRAGRGRPDAAESIPARRRVLRLGGTPVASAGLPEPPEGCQVVRLAFGERPPNAAFRVLGRPADAWTAAALIAAQRPEWMDSDLTVLLDVDQADRSSIQLLANYLRVAVAVPAGRVPDGEPGGGWLTAQPRRPAYAPEAGGGRAAAVPMPALQHTVVLRGVPTGAPPAPGPRVAAAAEPKAEPRPAAEAEPPAPQLRPLPERQPAPDGPEVARPGETPLPADPATQRAPRRRPSRRLVEVVLAAVTVAGIAGYMLSQAPSQANTADPRPGTPSATGSSDGSSPASPGVGAPLAPTASLGGTALPASATVPASPLSPAAPPGRPAPPSTRTPTAGPPTMTMPGKVNTTGRDLALDGTVTASSVESPNAPIQAIDGNPDTRWGSGFGVDPQWLTVDLGTLWQITQVKLMWEAAYATSYRIDVSQDGSTWRTVFQTSSGTGGTVTIPITRSPARYVRMFGTARAQSLYGYSLWEFEVH